MGFWPQALRCTLPAGKPRHAEKWCLGNLPYFPKQDVLDGRGPKPGDELPAPDRATLLANLRIMDEVTSALRAKRLADGALELASVELRFKVCFCVCVLRGACFHRAGQRGAPLQGACILFHSRSRGSGVPTFRAVPHHHGAPQHHCLC